MSQKLVSVIMPTFNGGKFLSSSIESILNQTHRNLELLITDDGSDEELALHLLKEYSEKDNRVKVEYLKGNSGPGVARNKSIERAQGRYIAFCDSDDRWFPEKLERQLAYMEEKDCALCSSSYLVCDENDNLCGINISPKHITFSMMKRDNKIGCLTAIYDTQRLGRKFYMPELRKRQDWALFLSILKQCRTSYAITEPLAYYRDHSSSVSSNKFSLIKYNVKVYQTILGYNLPKALTYFTFMFLPTYTLKVIGRRIDWARQRL